MVVTPDTVVVHVPADIPFGKYARVLRDANSPAAASAQAMYDMTTRWAVSTAFQLAVFSHESGFGRLGICANFDTKSPGNTRSSRTGKGTVINVPNRGPFVKYDTWGDGAEDQSFRLTDETYVYHQEGRRTIRQIIERFAPASDNNVPERYIAAVVSDMNAWIEEAPPMAGAQIEGFAWVPETANEFGYPQGAHGRNGREIDRLIMHCTIGRDSLAWLTGAHGNSVHLLDWPDGTPRAQMVALEDAAWGAGNREYNERGVNYEHEATEAEMLNPWYWTDAIVNNMAKSAAKVIRRHPKILPDRQHVIGHVEVPNQDHTDPGPAFPWDRFMAAIKRELDGTPPVDPNALYVPETDKWIVNLPGAAMLTTWRAEGAVARCGYPLEGMIQREDSAHEQLFENVLIELYPDGSHRFGGLGQRYVRLLEDGTA